MTDEWRPCKCDAFRRWYTDDERPPLIEVCTCGHPAEEHVQLLGACTGEVKSV